MQSGLSKHLTHIKEAEPCFYIYIFYTDVLLLNRSSEFKTNIISRFIFQICSTHIVFSQAVPAQSPTVRILAFPLSIANGRRDLANVVILIDPTCGHLSTLLDLPSMIHYLQ